MTQKTPNLQLTPNFTLRELTRSATAKRLGIDNTPSDTVIVNLLSLAQTVLQPLRDHVGGPITVNSGYRCTALNSAVGGVKNSQHISGEAADIKAPDRPTALSWLVWVSLHLDFDQAIVEHNDRGAYWLHVSCKRDPAFNRRDTVLEVHQSNTTR